MLLNICLFVNNLGNSKKHVDLEKIRVPDGI